MTKKELESQTIMELRSLAGRSDVPLRRSWTKSEIVAAILRTTSPKRGRKPKPVVVKPPKPEPARKKTASAAAARKAVATQPESVAKPAAAPFAANIQRSEAKRRATSVRPNAAEARGIPKIAPNLPIAPLQPSIVNNLTALMARDPHTLFVYWELKDTIPCEGISLRLHDLTSRDRHGVSDRYEYPVNCRTGGRYLFLRLPGRRFVCEMVSSAQGRHVVLARSGEVETPTDRMTVPAQAVPAQAVPAHTGAARLYETVFGVQAGAEICIAEIVSPSSRII